MDRPGISYQNILDTAGLIRETARRKKAGLVGLDIMEFNMHFLGLETEDGIRDNTLKLVSDYMETLLSS
jgi:hypothetical protein